MEIDDNVAVVAGVEEQAPVPRIKTAIKPKVRQVTGNRRSLVFIIVYPSSFEFLFAVKGK